MKTQVQKVPSVDMGMTKMTYKFHMNKSYRRAVTWIALNDETACTDLEKIAGSLTVAMASDCYGVHRDRVAEDVLKIRERELV